MVDGTLERLEALASEWGTQRSERQRRRQLAPADFEQLRATGFPLLAVPRASGGSWVGIRESTRSICQALWTVAQVDSSVALVSAMHPSVLAFWLSSPEAPEPYREAWAGQQEAVWETVRNGAWWGTITSEPGSGGDVARSSARAASAAGGGHLLTGAKHFGSGSGIHSYMLTSALPDGETEPDWFYLDVRDVPWDGSAGMTLTAEWDGAGMTATQSHGFRFEGFPARRFAWERHLLGIQKACGGAVTCYFAAVVTGIAEVAMRTAREQIARRREPLRAYEQVEWSRAEIESWLIAQAYEGMLRAVEEDAGTPVGVRCGKIAIAELAESLLGRLCRVLGGGTYSRYSPFSYWFEDVRALGFLRPPWGLAFDALHHATLGRP
ncbi:MAG: acyl-CoA dehydrogenase, short-chain specific [Armatimonadetes bacterium]|jgi:alkylation response protein AidB-like acyl-CoA dehydrogenase|nr:acyl-CoA dehydrogenase, short-chain specific [Armatimonadota bacterium]